MNAIRRVLLHAQRGLVERAQWRGKPNSAAFFSGAGDAPKAIRAAYRARLLADADAIGTRGRSTRYRLRLTRYGLRLLKSRGI